MPTGTFNFLETELKVELRAFPLNSTLGILASLHQEESYVNQRNLQL